ncbi:DNA repair protein complementing XP-C cells-like [Wyeomyia smithii]|uniref:DNA repair protein complementing XP-C cells-like n=1 Tax=Wyeomyia smithii TaxID=174621 RepID=UPI0024681AD8|nr:DNA repair protein complementing XP-C cells-like [Wyeomyia smithii]
MNLPRKLTLRDKIYRNLPDDRRKHLNDLQTVASASARLNIPQTQIDTRQPVGSDTDTDSEGSLDDHLVNLEDIDLDSQFFSQDYTTQVFKSSETVVKQTGEDQDLNLKLCNAEEDRVVYEKLTQLANYERIRNETREQLLERNNRIKAEPNNVSKLFCKDEICLDNTVLTENASDEEWVPIQDCSDSKLSDNVEVLINQQSLKSGKIVDINDQLKKLMQNERREKQLALHKTHLLCLMARGFYLNNLVSDLVTNHGQKLLEVLQNMCADVPEYMDRCCLEQICNNYRNSANLQSRSQLGRLNFYNDIANNVITSKEFYVLLFTAILRFLSIEARLTIHINAISKNPSSVKCRSQPEGNKNTTLARRHLSITTERYPDVPLTTTEILKRKPELAQFSQLDGTDDLIVEEKRPRLCESLDSKPKLWKLRRLSGAFTMKSNLNNNRSKSIKSTGDTRSSYFMQTQKKTCKNRPTSLTYRTPLPLECLSIWTEVMLPVEKRWHPVDILSVGTNSLDSIVDSLLQPPAYIFGWCGDGTLQDVTPRYWWRNEVGARRLRISDKWLHPILSHFGRRRKDIRDLFDVQEFRQLRHRAPIPEKLSEFKNHPSYCLKRDLLKFQAIYPADAPPLGFFREEPIYARECVHTLHSREVWLRHAKVIRLREQPYKIVSSKLKREKTDLELFGYWQTEEYIPPEPENGRVPRNAYGNIEIFKDCMLPRGTVHLKQSNISKICRRLNVDYATAVVGFGVHAGGNHPVFEGIVICKEFEEQVLQEYERDKTEQEQRKHQQREKTIYANWRKLIKGLLIRNRLKNKYNFDAL